MKRRISGRLVLIGGDLSDDIVADIVSAEYKAGPG